MSSKSQSQSSEPSHATTDVDTVDDKFFDDAPLGNSIRILDHPRANEHGTYIYGIRYDFEPLQEYEDGGYHPIHLGDTLGTAGRYRVINKLGHGGFGTVWLCRDMQDPGYVAVKVMTADVTLNTLPDFTLTNKLDRSLPGAEYLAAPLDSFSITGPNGSHQCIVLPVLGPPVSPRLWMELKKDPEAVLRGMAHQAALAMNFLHKQGLCHGGNNHPTATYTTWLETNISNFRPANILVKVANLNQLTEDELLSLLGHPEKAHVHTESGEDLPPFSPQYLVYAADLCALGDKYLTDQICVIDFGESYPISSPPEELGIPEHYRPPEVLLGQENSIGLACDLWALGCTLFEIREQIPLFYMIPDSDELLVDMVRFFGKLPQVLWDKWEAREKYFDDKGTYLRKSSEEEWSLEVALSKPSEIG